MNLLLTRPKAQADAMAEALRSRGHRIHLAPLLRVDRLQFDDRILRSASAIIITSANAVPALEGLDPAVRIFAVGPDTALAAKAAGFSNVMAATGTASSLLGMVRHQWHPEDGTLAYASGHHVSADIAGALALKGYGSRRVEVYATSQALQLPEETVGLFRRGEIDVVLFMSVRTADAFSELVAAAGISDGCRSARSLSLSDKIAGRVAHLPWIEPLSSGFPTRDGILRLVDDLAACREGATGAMHSRRKD